MDAYGLKGDGTFECIGLTLKKGQVVDQKCYRLAALNPSAWNEEYIRAFITEKLGCTDSNGMKLFGMSEKIGQEGTSNRISFKIDNKKDVKFCENVVTALVSGNRTFLDDILELNHIVQQCLNSNKFAIEQIGFDINEQECISEIKMYASLYQFDNAESVTGVIADKENYQQLIKRVGDLYQLNGIKEMLNSWLDYACYPILLGLNKKGDITELKIYFRYYENVQGDLEFLDFLNSINENAEKFDPILGIMQWNDLFLKGFSLCWTLHSMEMTVKPYFYKK